MHRIAAHLLCVALRQLAVLDHLLEGGMAASLGRLSVERDALALKFFTKESQTFFAERPCMCATCETRHKMRDGAVPWLLVEVDYLVCELSQRTCIS